MRRFAWLVYLVLMFAVVGCGTEEELDASYLWERVETQVEVQRAGGLVVTETLTVRFRGGPFTTVFRDLPSEYLDSISEFRVSEGEQAYTQVTRRLTREPGTFAVYEEDRRQRVRWVFPPTADAARTFVLRYYVDGAVARYDAEDIVRWSVVFPERESPVVDAVGRIRLPMPVLVDQFAVELLQGQAVVEQQPGVAVIRAQDILPGDAVTVVLHLPKGVVGGTMPRWQVREIRRAEFEQRVRPLATVISAVIAGLLALGMPILLWLWWRGHHDPRAPKKRPRALDRPPDGLGPALAGQLVGQPLARVLVALLLDLAERGHLSLSAQKKGRDMLVTVRRASGPARDIAPFEQETLKLLFGEEKEIALRSQVGAQYRQVQRLRGRYERELIDRGYLSDDGLGNRNQAQAIGVFLSISGVAVGVATAAASARYGWMPAAIGAVLLVMGLAWLLVSTRISGVSAFGAAARARWRAFGVYLKRLPPGSAPTGHFGDFMRYAAGIADMPRLIRAYATSDEPLPNWYRTAASRYLRDVHAEITDLAQAMLVAASAPPSAAPKETGGAG